MQKIVEHGISGYNRRKCRCEICVNAYAKYKKAYRKSFLEKEENKRPHGLAGYKHGCTCEICTKAKDDYNTKRREDYLLKQQSNPPIKKEPKKKTNKDFVHGLNAYWYRNCRCDICKNAFSEYQKNKRKEKKRLEEIEETENTPEIVDKRTHGTFSPKQIAKKRGVAKKVLTSEDFLRKSFIIKPEIKEKPEIIANNISGFTIVSGFTDLTD